MEPTSTPIDVNPADDPRILQRINAELLQTNPKLQRKNEQLRHRLDLLLKRLYGPRSEQITGPTLFDGFDPPEQPTPEPEPPPAKPKRPGHGRQKLSKALPRQRIDHDLSETEKLCPCCQTLRVKIGDIGRDEELHFFIPHPSSLIPPSESLPDAPLPPQPIDMRIPGPRLLSHF